MAEICLLWFLFQISNLENKESMIVDIILIYAVQGCLEAKKCIQSMAGLLLLMITKNQED